MTIPVDVEAWWHAESHCWVEVRVYVAGVDVTDHLGKEEMDHAIALLDHEARVQDEERADNDDNWRRWLGNCD